MTENLAKSVVLDEDRLRRIAELHMLVAEAVRDRSYQQSQLGSKVADYLAWKLNEAGAAESTVADYEVALGSQTRADGVPRSSHARLCPVTLKEAKRFVWEHHRHNRAPIGWRFGVGLMVDGELVGVAIASYPSARALHDGQTIEILRCCTDGSRNACSRLYGAIHRAAAALGYSTAITYTLASEPGSSLRAVGYEVDEELPPRGWGGGRDRYEENLLGEAQRPTEAKIRWRKALPS